MRRSRLVSFLAFATGLLLLVIAASSDGVDDLEPAVLVARGPAVLDAQQLGLATPVPEKVGACTTKLCRRVRLYVEGLEDTLTPTQTEAQP
jgi:hypothetical protein